MFSSFPRQLSATMSLAMVVVAVASCSALGPAPQPPRSTPGALAFVVGGRNNMPKPQLPDSLDKVVEDSIRSGDTIYIVDVSGHPVVSYTKPTSVEASECDSVSACNAVVGDYQGVIKREISKVKATTAEANTLEAIAEAARQMAGQSGAKRVVVIDNGLQTIGEMPLVAQGALFTPPEEVVRGLRDNNRLESALKGVDITWVGLGAVAAPQARPDQRPRNSLESLWAAVLTASGATVHFMGGINDGPPGHEGLPPVTPVPVEDRPIKLGPCATIPEDQIGFIPNEAAFRDPAVARTVLEPIAKALIEGKRTAGLIGYVALPENPGPDQLSLRRAVAVQDVLVSLGVPKQSLNPVGAGTPPEYPRPPAEPKPTELQQYRRVEVHVAGSC